MDNEKIVWTLTLQEFNQLSEIIAKHQIIGIEKGEPFDAPKFRARCECREIPGTGRYKRCYVSDKVDYCLPGEFDTCAGCR